MTGSVNHPWGIPEKAIKRYGKTWANTDFVMQNIHESQFKNDPMNTKVGTLHVGNTKIPMKFKNVISEATKLFNVLDTLYPYKKDKSRKFEVLIMNKDFVLSQLEIRKVAETLETAAEIIPKGYQLGLYL
tara:strand:+ start:250 stop:639 length:390 start_codon:yes stop_codon:yes gene_type:complete